MLDSVIKLAQCQRCQAYVWTADVAGGRVTVDPAPLGDLGAVMAALAGMRSVYEVKHIGKQPHKLKWLGGQGTRWEPEGRVLVAAHGCGAPARDAQPAEVTPQGPQQAPATPGGHQGGFRPASAHDSGSQGRTADLDLQGEDRPSSRWKPYRSRAASATRPRSDVTPLTRTLKCGNCGQIILAGQPFTAIECGQYSWAHHDYECIRELYENGRKRREFIGWDASDQLYKRGDWNRDVEDVIEGL